MKSFSKEIIEIDGKEYSLFLNREGIVSFEQYSKNETSKIKELTEKIKQITEQDNNSQLVIDDNANPFEDKKIIEKNEIIEEVETANKNLYKRLYWIMLYTEHKLSVSQASELYDKACEEYGMEQIHALADQIVEDANTNQVNNEQLKKLPALRPKK